MLKILVFTTDLDFYSEQLLSGISRLGHDVACVVDPSQFEKFAKWNSTLSIVAKVSLKGRLDKAASKRYTELIVMYEPDICLCYTSRALSVALKAKRDSRLRVPIIGTRGAIGGISCWQLEDWFSYLNPSLSAVICMSEAIQIRLVRQARKLWASHPGNFVTIYQGYSSLVSSAATRHHCKRLIESPRVIATIANERPIKGMSFFLDTLEYHLNFDNWKFLWIGEVSESTQKRIASSPRLRDRVVCLGYRRDARSLLAGADLYVQPTLSPGEGIGNSIAEAMAAELAVVTSNVGGALELVSAVSTELLFEPANSHSLARTLEKFLADPALCERLGRAGPEILIKRFQLDREIQLHIDLFQTTRLPRLGLYA